MCTPKRGDKTFVRGISRKSAARCSDLKPLMHGEEPAQGGHPRAAPLRNSKRKLVTSFLLKAAAFLVVVSSLPPEAHCQTLGRIGILGGYRMAEALRQKYMTCLILSFYGLSKDPSTYLTQTLGNDFPVENAELHHNLTVETPNLLQSDGFEGKAKFGDDKTLTIKAARYYCRCLDPNCVTSRALLKRGGSDQCLMLVNASDPSIALNCGDFLSFVDPMRVEAEEHLPNLPLDRVFLNDSRQQAFLNDIPEETLDKEVNKEVHGLVRALRSRESGQVLDFLTQEYQWRRLAAEEDPAALAAGLKNFQGFARRTVLDPTKLDGNSGIWVYRRNRTDGIIIATVNGTIVYPELTAANTEELTQLLSPYAQSNISFSGSQSLVDAQDAQSCFAIGPDFVAFDRNETLYKLVAEVNENGESLSCLEEGLSQEILVGVSGANRLGRTIDIAEVALPTLETEVAIADREAPVPASRIEIALVILAATLTLVTDPITSVTELFIRRVRRANRWLAERMVRVAGSLGNTANHCSGRCGCVADCMGQGACTTCLGKVGRAILAALVIVLPDFIGFWFPFVPLIVLLVNEFKVNSWSHTTYDVNVMRIRQPASNSTILVNTAITVTTEQNSLILKLVLVLAALILAIALALHWRKIQRWILVSWRTCAGRDIAKLQLGQSSRDGDWFDKWLWSMLCDNCKDLVQNPEEEIQKMSERYTV
ncbi:unnamed protein product [Ostreobium quekettii]|uniref:Uncharacterized protein n=1 Tax=Ostreobium quekettii TaxID=121088 RepID=A0A8S1ILH8_9CHLO|nr:unnamed protein product [Ostreobium quekettii]|eukprot:evm.model.scf_9.3 EVM.evm.TU.scf_9.3   scf_9:32153-34279(+)